MTVTYYAKYKDDIAVGLQTLSGGEQPYGDWQVIDLTTFESLRNNLGDSTALKDVCKNEIDAFAGDVRLRFITSAPGQAETYMLKADEAKRLISLNYAYSNLDAEYPLIAAECFVTGATVPTVCNTIVYMENMWRQLAAAIEKIRLGGKAQISVANTIVDILNIRNTTVNLLDQIR